MFEGDLIKAEHYFNLSNSFNSTKDSIEALGLNLLKMGKEDEARLLLSENNYYPNYLNSYDETKKNLKYLHNYLDNKNISLIVMQYPALNTDFIQNIFDDNEDVLIVDSNTILNKDLIKNKYDSLFIDKQGVSLNTVYVGYYGHCTKLCSKLIGENLANKIQMKFLS
ncbi:hypothetical protein HN789_02640 [archaeon]|jgi:hypothetical protein|nr:hypothetical protein [archaeon]MBT4021955.1 hypothetical protein [archaeon]MBT4272272.1 hypothetical protein [archaeon]MBT4460808.1 hypothetical protein [archaeon]MBT4858376.1 hypothetical protein [archaeon]